MEALAATWACEKFAPYVTGMSFTVETDHKPLVPLLSTKDLSKMPPRILRFRLRMMRYAPKMIYVQGKCQVTADALSRAPANSPNEEEEEFVDDVEEFTVETLKFKTASSKKLEEISDAQDADEDCAEIKRFCREGWPAFMHNSPTLHSTHTSKCADASLYITTS